MDKEIKLIIKAIKEGQGFEQIRSGLEAVEGQAKKTNKGVFDLNGMLKGLLPAMGVAAVVAGFKFISDEAMQSEKSTRLLTQTIKNLGMENKITAEQVQDLADNLSALAGVEDEEVIDATTQFLKVTKDANASMELSKLALDMATGSGKSYGEAADALTKALQGNTRGLKEFGISAKEGASTMQTLQQVTDLYAGSAEKFGETTEGSLKKTMASFSNLGEVAGKAFLPILGGLANLTTTIIKGWIGITSIVTTFFQKLGNYAMSVGELVKGNFAAWGEASKKNKELEEKMWTDLEKVYREKTDSEKSMIVDTSKFKGLHLKADQDAAKKAAQTEAELFDKRSERAKKYWLRQVELAGDSQEKQKTVLEKSLKDARLNHEDKEELDQKLKKTELGIQEDYEDSVKGITSSIAEGGLSGLKSEIEARIKAWGAEESAKAIIQAPMTFGASLAQLPLIAAGVATGLAALNAIQLAEGGIVTKPTRAVIGEAGPEAVIPLKKAGGALGMNTININVGAMMGKDTEAYQFSKMVDKQLTRISRRQITT